MELRVTGCYYNGRRIDVEHGEPLRGSIEAQCNVTRTMIRILQRVERERVEREKAEQNQGEAG